MKRFSYSNLVSVLTLLLKKNNTLSKTMVTTFNEVYDNLEDLDKRTTAAQETADANAYIHPSVTAADTTSVETPNYGGSFTVINAVTRDSSGHVTGVDTKTVTLPAASLTASCDSDTEELTLEANCFTVSYSDEVLALTAV